MKPVSNVIHKMGRLYTLVVVHLPFYLVQTCLPTFGYPILSTKVHSFFQKS